MSAQYEAIELAVSAILADCGIVFSAVLVDGNAVDENGWKHAAWKVAFSGQGRQTFSTPYRMGTGLAYRGRMRVFHLPPSPATVLHSLISDASAADSTFEDWAADMGLNPDSRKALAMYLACQETAASLRRLFGSAILEMLSAAVRDF